MIKVWKKVKEHVREREERKNEVKEGGRVRETETEEQRDGGHGWRERDREEERGRGREGGGGRERCYCSHLNSSTLRMNYSWATCTPVTSLPSKKTWKNRGRKEKILECSFLIVRRGGGSCPHLIGWYKQWECILHSEQTGEWGTPSHLPRLVTLQYPQTHLILSWGFSSVTKAIWAASDTALFVCAWKGETQTVSTEMHNRLDLFLVATSSNGLKTDKWHFLVYNLFCFLI